MQQQHLNPVAKNGHLDVESALAELGLRLGVRLAQGCQLSSLSGGVPVPGSQLPAQRARTALRPPQLRCQRLNRRPDNIIITASCLSAAVLIC